MYTLHGVTREATGIIGGSDRLSSLEMAIRSAVSWLKANPTTGLEVIILNGDKVQAFIYSETAKVE